MNTYSSSLVYLIGQQVLVDGIVYQATARVPLATSPPNVDYWEVVAVPMAFAIQGAGSGSPVGSVVPNLVGNLWVDNTTPGLYQATGLADTDWVAFDTAAVGILSWGTAAEAKFTYAGDPSGHVTPAAKGDLCVDTTTPALYQATGTADTDWSLIGPLPVSAITGSLSTVADSAAKAVLTSIIAADVAAGFATDGTT